MKFWIHWHLRIKWKTPKHTKKEMMRWSSSIWWLHLSLNCKKRTIGWCCIHRWNRAMPLDWRRWRPSCCCCSVLFCCADSSTIRRPFWNASVHVYYICCLNNGFGCKYFIDIHQKTIITWDDRIVWISFGKRSRWIVSLPCVFWYDEPIHPTWRISYHIPAKCIQTGVPLKKTNKWIP